MRLDLVSKLITPSEEQEAECREEANQNKNENK